MHWPVLSHGRSNVKDFVEQIQKRRTFAIISHPDAGKTTLTEKLLLYGGAIQQAGIVKGKKGARAAVSDWMEIEKQRGISVTSSVLQFEYDGYCINILDTPGHQDFSEDTYRTLMAADSAVMVIDAAKGVEAQTKKLFKVCTMRGIPIFTFINKMDREARNPFDLLEEIEQVLGIETYPMNWPIGSGKDFKGVYDRNAKEILAFQNVGKVGTQQAQKIEAHLGDENLDQLLTKPLHDTLKDDIELLDGAAYEFDKDKVDHGKLTPVFFGSALTNFGVEPFLADFLRLSMPPLPRTSDRGEIDPCSEDFSAFVFKIQANMNKAHRDRIAFMRICSGRFERGMDVYHVQGGKKIKLSQSTQLMASERETVDEAFAGDIIGIFDPGVFSIGDTITTAKVPFAYAGIPTFAPEHFARISQVDTMKRKQFVKGMEQIAQEGAIQIFKELGGGMEEVIVGVVGVLQFEVLEYRLKNEYNVDIRRNDLSYSYIRWIENEDLDPKTLNLTSDTRRVEDFKGRRLLLFTSPWNIDWALEHNEGLRLSEVGR
ncbi:peptide chain release factor 3 [Ruthenibacterium sp. CLA-JM-H11]|uniref:Peptide chain release factor 3 n=1 Tax=Ruthenibacterium intestinale TaxID=3133163 RepID=A0ABV1GEG3_9FIRM